MDKTSNKLEEQLRKLEVDLTPSSPHSHIIMESLSRGDLMIIDEMGSILSFDTRGMTYSEIELIYLNNK